MERWQQRQTAAAREAAEIRVWRIADERAVSGEEIADDGSILGSIKRTCGIKKSPARSHPFAEIRQEFALSFGGGGNLPRSRRPLEMRSSTPRAGAAAPTGGAARSR